MRTRARTSMAFLAALTLSACAVGGHVSTMGQTFLPEMPGVDRQAAQRLIDAEAPRIQVTLVDRGTTSLLVKDAERQGVSRWRTIDNTQIFTRDGIVVGTRGLSFDLMSADTGDAAAAILARRAARVVRFHTYLDGDDQTRIQSYVCDIVPEGQQDIHVSESLALSGSMVRETCYNPRGDHENLYLLRDGHILATVQFISRGIGSLQIVFFS